MKKILLLTCIAFFACNFLNANSRNEAFNIVQESVLNIDYQLMGDDDSSAPLYQLELCGTFIINLDTIAPGCTFLSWESEGNLRVIVDYDTYTFTVIGAGLGGGYIGFYFDCAGTVFWKPYYFSVFAPSPLPYYLFDNYSTTGNMNITYDCLINGTFTINTGHTVDLYGDVFATYRAKIIVQPGANLYIHGATLTSYCDVMWDGIEVRGINSAPPVNGVVRVLDGATIENAYTGINALDGGYVYTNGLSVVNFTNNATGIRINPLSNGRFEQIHFLIDTDYLGFLYRFHAHLILYNGKRNEVVNCSFKNDNPLLYPYPPTPSEDNNSGIIVFDSGLIIEGGTDFSGFSTGIFAANSGAMPEFKVEGCVFVNNARGIRLSGFTGSIIYGNEFDLSYFDAIGITAYNSTDYIITENTFLNLSTPSQSTGMRISESGIADNKIEKNYFYDLNIGIQTIGENSNQQSGGLEGLQFICNEFWNTLQTDLLVSLGSIRKYQGASSEAAGNKFYPNSTTRPSITSYSTTTMYYYFNMLNFMVEYPTVPPFGTVPGIVITSPAPENPCLSLRSNTLEQYDLWNSEYQYWLAKLLEFEGDNEEEYNMILSNISYFGGLKNNYFNKIIAEVLNKELTEEEIEDPALKLKNLRFLFEYRGSYTDYLGIIETYMAEKSYDNALITLANMYKLFELNETQTGELKGLDIYVSWRRKLDSEGNSILKLSSKEVDELVKYVETNTGRGVVFANNILCVLYGICIEKETPLYSAPQNQTNSSQKSSLQTDAQALLDKITVIPNPTTGELRITNYELRIDKIEVLDITGRIVSSNHLITSSSNLKIDISNLNAGIYFVKIVTEQGVTVKKVTKQ